MNQRIKELALQAGLLPREIGPVVETRHMKKKEQDLEKFAELIVKECAEIALEQKKWVEDMEVHNPNDEAWNRARIQQSQHIVDKITQHFGVEE